MKKTTAAITTLTYTEILGRAISSIEGEIEDWRIKCEGLPPEQREQMFALSTTELRAKLETAKTLYRIETGVEC